MDRCPTCQSDFESTEDGLLFHVCPGSPEQADNISDTSRGQAQSQTLPGQMQHQLVSSAETGDPRPATEESAPQNTSSRDQMGQETTSSKEDALHKETLIESMEQQETSSKIDKTKSKEHTEQQSMSEEKVQEQTSSPKQLPISQRLSIIEQAWQQSMTSVDEADEETTSVEGMEMQEISEEEEIEIQTLSIEDLELQVISSVEQMEIETLLRKQYFPGSTQGDNVPSNSSTQNNPPTLWTLDSNHTLTSSMINITYPLSSAVPTDSQLPTVATGGPPATAVVVSDNTDTGPQTQVQNNSVESPTIPEMPELSTKPSSPDTASLNQDIETLEITLESQHEQQSVEQFLKPFKEKQGSLKKQPLVVPLASSEQPCSVDLPCSLQTTARQSLRLQMPSTNSQPSVAEMTSSQQIPLFVEQFSPQSPTLSLPLLRQQTPATQLPSSQQAPIAERQLTPQRPAVSLPSNKQQPRIAERQLTPQRPSNQQQPCIAERQLTPQRPAVSLLSNQQPPIAERQLTPQRPAVSLLSNQQPPIAERQFTPQSPAVSLPSNQQPPIAERQLTPQRPAVSLPSNQQPHIAERQLTPQRPAVSLPSNKQKVFVVNFAPRRKSETPKIHLPPSDHQNSVLVLPSGNQQASGVQVPSKKITSIARIPPSKHQISIVVLPPANSQTSGAKKPASQQTLLMQRFLLPSNEEEVFLIQLTLKKPETSIFLLLPPSKHQTSVFLLPSAKHQGSGVPAPSSQQRPVPEIPQSNYPTTVVVLPPANIHPSDDQLRASVHQLLSLHRKLALQPHSSRQRSAVPLPSRQQASGTVRTEQSLSQQRAVVQPPSTPQTSTALLNSRQQMLVLQPPSSQQTLAVSMPSRQQISEARMPSTQPTSVQSSSRQRCAVKIPSRQRTSGAQLTARQSTSVQPPSSRQTSAVSVPSRQRTSVAQLPSVQSISVMQPPSTRQTSVIPRSSRQRTSGVQLPSMQSTSVVQPPPSRQNSVAPVCSRQQNSVAEKPSPKQSPPRIISITPLPPSNQQQSVKLKTPQSKVITTVPQPSSQQTPVAEKPSPKQSPPRIISINPLPPSNQQQSVKPKTPQSKGITTVPKPTVQQLKLHMDKLYAEKLSSDQKKQALAQQKGLEEAFLLLQQQPSEEIQSLLQGMPPRSSSADTLGLSSQQHQFSQQSQVSMESQNSNQRVLLQVPQNHTATLPSDSQCLPTVQELSTGSSHQILSQQKSSSSQQESLQEKRFTQTPMTTRDASQTPSRHGFIPDASVIQQDSSQESEECLSQDLQKPDMSSFHHKLPQTDEIMVEDTPQDPSFFQQLLQEMDSLVFQQALTEDTTLQGQDSFVQGNSEYRSRVPISGQSNTSQSENGYSQSNQELDQQPSNHSSASFSLEESQLSNGKPTKLKDASFNQHGHTQQDEQQLFIQQLLQEPVELETASDAQEHSHHDSSMSLQQVLSSLEDPVPSTSPQQPADEGQPCLVRQNSNNGSNGTKPKKRPKMSSSHKKDKQGPSVFKCVTCKEEFSTLNGLSRHYQVHIGGRYRCSKCSAKFTTVRRLAQHKALHKQKKI